MVRKKFQHTFKGKLCKHLKLKLIIFQGISVNDCRTSIFGCCPDGITPAEGPNYENCSSKTESESETKINCETTEFGCCSDEITPAKGPFQDGCIDYSCRVKLILKHILHLFS